MIPSRTHLTFLNLPALVSLSMVILAILINFSLVREAYLFNYHADVPNQAYEYFKSHSGTGDIPIQNRHMGFKLSFYHVMNLIADPHKPLLINALNTAAIFHGLTFVLIWLASIIFIQSWACRLFFIAALTIASPGYFSVFAGFSKEATSHGLLLVFLSYAVILYNRNQRPIGIWENALLALLLALAILNRSIATIFMIPFVALIAVDFLRRDYRSIGSSAIFLTAVIGVSLIGYQLLKLTLLPNMALEDIRPPIAIASEFIFTMKGGYAIFYERFGFTHWELAAKGAYRFWGGSWLGVVAIIFFLPLMFSSFIQALQKRHWIAILFLLTATTLPLLFEPTYSFRWAKTWSVMILICVLGWQSAPYRHKFLAVLSLVIFFNNNILRYDHFVNMSKDDTQAIQKLRNLKSLTIKADDTINIYHFMSLNPELIGKIKLIKEKEDDSRQCEVSPLDTNTPIHEWKTSTWQTSDCNSYDRFVQEINSRTGAF